MVSIEAPKIRTHRHYYTHPAVVEIVVDPLTTGGVIEIVRQKREAVFGFFSINNLFQEFSLPQEAATIVIDFLDEALVKRVLKNTPVTSTEDIQRHYTSKFNTDRETYYKLFENHASATTKENFLRIMAKSFIDTYDAFQANHSQGDIERTIQHCRDAADAYLQKH